MTDSQVKTEAKNTVIPQTIGICIILFILNLISINNNRKDFFGSIAIAFFGVLIISPFIYYFKLKAQIKKIKKIHDAVKEAYENIGLNGFTELMALSIDNKIEKIKQILDNGAEINLQNNKGYTALIYASNFGREDVVKLLLERGADKNISTANGKDALYFAKKINLRA